MTRPANILGQFIGNPPLCLSRHSRSSPYCLAPVFSATPCPVPAINLVLFRFWKSGQIMYISHPSATVRFLITFTGKYSRRHSHTGRSLATCIMQNKMKILCFPLSSRRSGHTTNGTRDSKIFQRYIQIVYFIGISAISHNITLLCLPQ